MALSGGNNRATTLFLNASPYRAIFRPYRPQVPDLIEATTILTQGAGVGGLASAGGGPSGGGEFNDYASGLTNSAAVQRGDDEAKKFNRDWFRYQPPKLEFRTRDFSLDNRVNIIRHQGAQRGLANPLRTYLMADFASHHQKMVLVDYDDPALAAGLMMGHNLLRNYWDTDEHAYHSEDRLGFKPWQDLSALVYGGVLFDLNENFMTAWDKAQRGGKKLYWSDVRKTHKPDDFAATAAQRGQTEVAQIVRTQPQEGDRSIRDLYLIALANARSYVYFENQYFRYTAFANALRTNRRKLKAHGWTRDFYIFVVTNVPGGEGKLATYDMLAALGKSATMPKYEKQAQESDGERELRKNDLQGVNIHVCTLCASTTARVSAYHTSTCYTDIYVHSKLLLIDDAFFTLGSANINTRSMEGDSELNIACPSPTLAKQWREHLWKIHTGGGVTENMQTEFDRWDESMKANKDLKKHQETLQSPLIEFFDAQHSSLAAD